MKGELVTLNGRNTTTTSLIVAKKFGKQHKNVLRTIEILNADLPEKDRLIFQPISVSDSYGRQQPAYQMNRKGFSLLAMRFTGKKALEWQIKFIDAFDMMEQALLNQHNLSWRQQRLDGKVSRRIETDTIVKFVEYATSQGSQSAKMYFMQITKMTHQALFLVKQSGPKSFRDMLDSMQLSFLTTAEYLIQQVLEDGMASALHYKDIYQLARDRVSHYAEQLPQQRLLIAA